MRIGLTVVCLICAAILLELLSIGAFAAPGLKADTAAEAVSLVQPQADAEPSGEPALGAVRLEEF
jgi:hypothetical protein